MSSNATDEATPADVEAVTRVATEYFESWFAGYGERIRACLHPALAKRTPETPRAESTVLYEDSRRFSSPTRPAVRAQGLNQGRTSGS